MAHHINFPGSLSLIILLSPFHLFVANNFCYLDVLLLLSFFYHSSSCPLFTSSILRCFWELFCLPNTHVAAHPFQSPHYDFSAYANRITTCVKAAQSTAALQASYFWDLCACVSILDCCREQMYAYGFRCGSIYACLKASLPLGYFNRKP